MRNQVKTVWLNLSPCEVLRFKKKKKFKFKFIREKNVCRIWEQVRVYWILCCSANWFKGNYQKMERSLRSIRNLTLFLVYVRVIDANTPVCFKRKSLQQSTKHLSVNVAVFNSTNLSVTVVASIYTHNSCSTERKKKSLKFGDWPNAHTWLVFR